MKPEHEVSERLDRWRPYTAYKDSGVEWLGEIPEHWKVDRLRWTITNCQNGIWGDEPDGVNDIACIRVADFERSAFRVTVNEPTMRAIALSERHGRILRKGDLLLEKSGGGELQPVGAIVGYDHETPAVCSNFMARVGIAADFDSRFLVYLHAHLYGARVNTRSIKQTTGIQNLDSMAYFDERAAWPPLDEQRTIAVFLDRETARIDTLIGKKERQVELLQEKRDALISCAVTKGLNPNAPLKDSGVEWLGKIPIHWEVWKISHGFGYIGSGTTPKSDDLQYYDGCILWVTTSELRETIITDTVNKLTEQAVQEYSTLRVYPPGTLLFAMYGATIGRMGILGVPATVNQACCAFTKPKQFDTRFVYYWLWMRRPVLIVLSTGGGQPNLSQDDLRNIRIPIPPLSEQRAIAEFLDCETARIDALIGKVKDSIELLHEYRTALISAAVTGKVDVRQEVA